jgi:hypothetical protein
MGGRFHRLIYRALLHNLHAVHAFVDLPQHQLALGLDVRRPVPLLGAPEVFVSCGLRNA